MRVHELWRGSCIVCESFVEYEGNGIWKCNCVGEEELTFYSLKIVQPIGTLTRLLSGT